MNRTFAKREGEDMWEGATKIYMVEQYKARGREKKGPEGRKRILECGTSLKSEFPPVLKSRETPRAPGEKNVSFF